jgi:hypothetical protein
MKTNMLKSVTECTGGHCDLHFPQFDIVSPEAFSDMLKRCIKDLSTEGDYAFDVYENRTTLIELFTRCLAMDYLDAAAEIEAFEGECYLSRGFYITKRGRLCKFAPCCR